MKICLNCCFASDGERCPVCGSKNMRAVDDDDFCLLTEKEAADFKAISDAFDIEDIAYSALPYGSGVATRLGLPLENYRVFVQYRCLEKAKEIIKRIDGEVTEMLRNFLLDGVENLNILTKTEKKIKRKAGLSDNADIFGYCIDIIRTAYKIADKGTITDCSKGGHYYFCYARGVTLAINSKTYEIISLDIEKKGR